MTWLDAAGFERRPLVFVEDHLYHTSEVLAALQAARPDLLASTTVVALESAGPDTDDSVAEWRNRYPTLQIGAPVAPRDRIAAIGPDDLADGAAYARLISRLLRPGGRLVVLELMPHEEMWVREQLGHRYLGFAPEAVADWLSSSGFTVGERQTHGRDARSPFRVFLQIGSKP